MKTYINKNKSVKIEVSEATNECIITQIKSERKIIISIESARKIFTYLAHDILIQPKNTQSVKVVLKNKNKYFNSLHHLTAGSNIINGYFKGSEIDVILKLLHINKVDLIVGVNNLLENYSESHYVR